MVSVFVGNEGAIKDAKKIIFVVSTGSESVKKSRLAEGGADSLGLTSKVKFSSSNDNFLLGIHSRGDAGDEVSNFCLQHWLLVVPSSNLS